MIRQRWKICSRMRRISCHGLCFWSASAGTLKWDQIHAKPSRKASANGWYEGHANTANGQTTPSPWHVSVHWTISIKSLSVGRLFLHTLSPASKHPKPEYSCSGLRRWIISGPWNWSRVSNGFYRWDVGIQKKKQSLMVSNGGSIIRWLLLYRTHLRIYILHRTRNMVLDGTMDWGFVDGWVTQAGKEDKTNVRSRYLFSDVVSMMKKTPRCICLNDTLYVRAEAIYRNWGGKWQLCKQLRVRMELDNLCCASPLERLLSIIASLTGPHLSSCILCLQPIKSNLQEIDRLVTKSFMNDVPCV